MTVRENTDTFVAQYTLPVRSLKQGQYRNVYILYHMPVDGITINRTYAQTYERTYTRTHALTRISYARAYARMHAHACSEL